MGITRTTSIELYKLLGRRYLFTAVKNFFYIKMWLMVCLALAFIVLLYFSKLPWRLSTGETISALGVLLSVFYFVQQHRHRELGLLSDKIQEFNARYDAINDRLDLRCKGYYRSDNTILFDCLNLCGEEYYWYTKGIIDNAAWCTWYEGIKQRLDDFPLEDKGIICRDLRSQSYYGARKLFCYILANCTDGSDEKA